MVWKGMRWGGTGTAEFRVIACRYGSVFGMIHIHKGEGIGVSKFFGLFSVQALTLVCKLLNMHTHTRYKRSSTHEHNSKHVELEWEDAKVVFTTELHKCLFGGLLNLKHISKFFIILIYNGITLINHSGVRQQSTVQSLLLIPSHMKMYFFTSLLSFFFSHTLLQPLALFQPPRAHHLLLRACVNWMLWIRAGCYCMWLEGSGQEKGEKGTVCPCSFMGRCLTMIYHRRAR